MKITSNTSIGKLFILLFTNLAGKFVALRTCKSLHQRLTSKANPFQYSLNDVWRWLEESKHKLGPLKKGILDIEFGECEKSRKSFGQSPTDKVFVKYVAIYLKKPDWTSSVENTKQNKGWYLSWLNKSYPKIVLNIYS